MAARGLRTGSHRAPVGQPCTQRSHGAAALQIQVGAPWKWAWVSSEGLCKGVCSNVRMYVLCIHMIYIYICIYVCVCLCGVCLDAIIGVKM